MSAFAESTVEEATLQWFEALGYGRLHGPDIAPGEPACERNGLHVVTLDGRLRAALARLNPGVPAEGLDEAFRKLTRIDTPQLIDGNNALHYFLVNGVDVEFLLPDGGIGHAPMRVLDFDDVENNDWIVVNQMTVVEGNHTRRPDVIAFVNGLPLAVIELKNAIAENATVWSAYAQLQTYKEPEVSPHITPKISFKNACSRSSSA